MTWLAENPEIVQAFACGVVIGVGLVALALVLAFTTWYDDRPERRRMREIIEEAEERKP